VQIYSKPCWEKVHCILLKTSTEYCIIDFRLVRGPALNAVHWRPKTVSPGGEICRVLICQFMCFKCHCYAESLTAVNAGEKPGSRSGLCLRTPIGPSRCLYSRDFYDVWGFASVGRDLPEFRSSSLSVIFCRCREIHTCDLRFSWWWRYILITVARSNTEIVGSNPIRGMDGVCFYSVFLCVGSGLARGWSPVQGVLQTVYRLRNWIAAKVQKMDCRAIDR
jgi:hypothetical protein